MDQIIEMDIDVDNMEIDDNQEMDTS